MKYVVIINGRPCSGKTTFENGCIDYLNKSEIAHGHIWSSIDFIKDIYKLLGWDGMKTSVARKHLSTLKKIWVETSNGSINYLINKIIGLSCDEDHVVFVDIRENNEIMTMCEILHALRHIGIEYTTVLITRNDINSHVKYGNESDDCIVQDESLYDHVIHNDKDMDQLRDMSKTFIKTLMEE